MRSLALREAHRLRTFESKVLKRMLYLRRKEENKLETTA
jgi:hypothetical protein